MAIRVLDAATVGRIAAGEVVERPSSVAKELLENALDAGATSVTVEMRDGGTTYLRVTDNGCGIDPKDARLAFENHATSKIRASEDLDDIRTLGFRGEALPSIAAVAKITLTTRVKGSETGVKCQIEGGQFLGMDAYGCPEGTTIVVRDLFYNTPVRKTFLKKPQYEAGVLADIVERMMLGNPKVSMRLIANGKTVCHSYGDGILTHAAYAVYGREVASQLTEMDEAEGGLRLFGLIGLGDCARNTRSGQSFFINGRLVRCPLLAQALERAAQGRVTIGMYPMCILHIELPPHAVDINVHPNKLEVRFRDEAAVRESVAALFARTLENKEAMLDVRAIAREPLTLQTEVRIKQTEVQSEPTKVQIEQTEVQEKPTEVQKEKPVVVQLRIPQAPTPPTDDREITKAQDMAAYVPRRTLNEALELPVEKPAVIPEAPPREEPVPPTIRVIGVALQTYLLLEVDSALVLVDQHAAHERILYERYVKLLDQGIASQPLLTPLVVPVTPREQAILVDSAALLQEAGYEIEPFGERDIRVRAVPFVLGKAEMQPLFVDLIDRLDQVKSAAVDKRRGEIIQFSCKHAVKAGDALTEGEIQALIEEMLKTGAPPTCPHGRPILRAIKKAELERMFKRQQ